MPSSSELKEMLHVLKMEKLQLDKGWIPIRSKARDVDAKIKEIEEAIRTIILKPRVSDHALLRYLQRKYKVNFDDLRDEILSDNVIAAIELGACSITVGGYQYMIVEKCITTILDKGMTATPRKKSEYAEKIRIDDDEQ